ncbi:MAG: hypothetical protein AAF211_08905 [Myxococcota bacterium]
MRWSVLFFVGCGSPIDQRDVTPWADVSCDHLFGAPGPNTGLGDDECKPEVTAGDEVWSVPAYTAGDIAELRDWTWVDPPAPLEVDPYTEPDAWPLDESSVCGLTVVDEEARTYRLDTFASQEAAWEAGARVTHGGACGLCSSLEDLAVYIEQPDLTTPVRQCGVQNLGQPPLATVPCLQELGFTESCAQIWAYNVAHTAGVCTDICFSLLSATYHDDSGAPNDCIQCDEDNSGPVFKAASGRTRRNSGLPTSLCRSCDAVWRIDHRLAE